MCQLNHIVVVMVCWCFAWTRSEDINRLRQIRGRIAQCRASCLQHFADFDADVDAIQNEVDSSVDLSYNRGCTAQGNWKCNMCWDYCESLGVYERTRGQMCADDICLEGCKHACEFHNAPTTTTTTTTTMTTRKPSVEYLKIFEPKLTKDGVRIGWSWTGSSSSTFMVVGKTANSIGAWEEIQQTADQHIVLGADAPKYAEIIVLVYDPAGYVHEVATKLVFTLRPKRSIANASSKVHFDTTWSANVSYALMSIVIVSCAFVCIIVAGCICWVSLSRRKLKTAEVSWV